jgi:hypothetical protein
MTEAALSVPPATPRGWAVVAASRPAAWSVLGACAGRGPASPAAPRPGTLHPDADRPVACWTGCHLPAARLKGAAVLAALRSSRPCGMACGPP